jgi:rhodanese-related sulfurtransferase
MRHLLFAVFLAACGGGAPADHAFADISYDELKAAVEAKKAVVIDANGSSSFKEGHIPGAIDFEANKDKLATVLPADKNALVVAYCGGPQCSAWEDAAKVASSLGYKQVKHFTAGMKGWQDANGPVEM